MFGLRLLSFGPDNLKTSLFVNSYMLTTCKHTQTLLVYSRHCLSLSVLINKIKQIWLFCCCCFGSFFSRVLDKTLEPFTSFGS